MPGFALLCNFRAQIAGQYLDEAPLHHMLLVGGLLRLGQIKGL